LNSNTSRSALDHARDLVRRGYLVIRVPFKCKGSRDTGWPDLRLTEADLPAYFGDKPSNMAILLGEPAGMLVDVDLDHALAVELGDSFLPHTSATWGRQSKPKSHRLYRLTRPWPKQAWTSKAEGMIVELRSTGHASVAPGSTHPSGEAVRWDDEGEPATIDPEVLVAACEALARAVRDRLGEGPDDGPAPRVTRPIPPSSPGPGGTGTYGRAALDAEAAKVASTPEGSRNITLNAAAFAIGTLVGGGEIERHEAEAELMAAARACGLEEHEARATLKSGLDDGQAEPRQKPAPAVTTTRAKSQRHADQVTVTPRAPRLDLSQAFPRSAAYVREYVRAVSRSTQTPQEMAALLALGVASGTVAKVACVRGHGDHVEPAQIWALVLSEPGTRKSAVMSELTRPISTWEIEQAEQMKPEIAAAEQRKSIAERRLKRLQDEAAGNSPDAGQAEQLAIALSQEMAAERSPVAPALVTSEPTPEALARLMAANGERALVASAEGDALDIACGRYSGAKNFGLMLKAHAGDPYAEERVGRQGVRMKSPALAMALCVQPEAVRDLWADRAASGRGLLARFAINAPPDKIGTRDVRPDPVPHQTRKHWDAGIARLLAFAPASDETMIALIHEADALYHKYQIKVEAALGNGGELAARRAWGGKLCGLVLRVALTLHALGTWAKRGTPGDHLHIDAETMRAAIYWGDYLTEAHRHAEAVILNAEGVQSTERLVNWIDGKGGRVSASEVAHGVREYRNNADRARAALQALAEAGRGGFEWDQSPKGGPPTERFVLAEPVTVTETPGSSEDEAGSSDARDGFEPPPGGVGPSARGVGDDPGAPNWAKVG
jgi:hypothetical protein